MTLAKVYIRYKEDLPESEMMFSALEGFQYRGTETAPFYGFGDVQDLDLGPEVGIMGYIGDVWRALHKLGLPRPEPLDYPDDLHYLMGRDIERATLGDVRNRVNPGIFVKPVGHKMFTGFVMTGSFDDAIRLAPYPTDTEVWLSQAVEFVSEFRCYILKREVLGVHFYKGDWSKVPARKAVEGAIKAWESQPVAWTLDVGVTPSGQTLLVEVNDGYSFGNYGMRSTSYAQMIEAWWEDRLGVKT
jgi:ATP-grasp domain, R2K clade family 2